MSETVRICIQAELDKGEVYFKEEDAKLIRELRERHKKAADKEYRESRGQKSALTAADGREDIYFIIRVDDGIHFIFHVDCFATIDKKFHVVLKMIVLIQ